jgi:hypothetical protein
MLVLNIETYYWNIFIQLKSSKSMTWLASQSINCPLNRFNRRVALFPCAEALQEQMSNHTVKFGFELAFSSLARLKKEHFTNCTRRLHLIINSTVGLSHTDNNNWKRLVEHVKRTRKFYVRKWQRETAIRQSAWSVVLSIVFN